MSSDNCITVDNFNKYIYGIPKYSERYTFEKFKTSAGVTQLIKNIDNTTSEYKTKYETISEEDKNCYDKIVEFIKAIHAANSFDNLSQEYKDIAKNLFKTETSPEKPAAEAATGNGSGFIPTGSVNRILRSWFPTRLKYYTIYNSLTQEMNDLVDAIEEYLVEKSITDDNRKKAIIDLISLLSIASSDKTIRKNIINSINKILGSIQFEDGDTKKLEITQATEGGAGDNKVPLDVLSTFIKELADKYSTVVTVPLPTTGLLTGFTEQINDLVDKYTKLYNKDSDNTALLKDYETQLNLVFGQFEKLLPGNKPDTTDSLTVFTDILNFLTESYQKLPDTITQESEFERDGIPQFLRKVKPDPINKFDETGIPAFLSGVISPFQTILIKRILTKAGVKDFPLGNEAITVDKVVEAIKSKLGEVEKEVERQEVATNTDDDEKVKELQSELAEAKASLEAALASAKKAKEEAEARLADMEEELKKARQEAELVIRQPAAAAELNKSKKYNNPVSDAAARQQELEQRQAAAKKKAEEADAAARQQELEQQQAAAAAAAAEERKRQQQYNKYLADKQTKQDQLAAAKQGRTAVTPAVIRRMKQKTPSLSRGSISSRMSNPDIPKDLFRITLNRLNTDIGNLKPRIQTNLVGIQVKKVSITTIFNKINEIQELISTIIDYYKPSEKESDNKTTIISKIKQLQELSKNLNELLTNLKLPPKLLIPTIDKTLDAEIERLNTLKGGDNISLEDMEGGAPGEEQPAATAKPPAKDEKPLNIEEDVENIRKQNRKLETIKQQINDIKKLWESYKSSTPVKAFKDIQIGLLLDYLLKEISKAEDTTGKGINPDTTNIFSVVTSDKQLANINYYNFKAIEGENTGYYYNFNSSVSNSDPKNSFQKKRDEFISKLELFNNLVTASTLFDGDTKTKVALLFNTVKLFKNEPVTEKKNLQTVKDSAGKVIENTYILDINATYCKLNIDNIKADITTKIKQAYDIKEGYSIAEILGINEYLQKSAETIKRDINEKITNVLKEINDLLKTLTTYSKKYSQFNPAIKRLIYQKLEPEDIKDALQIQANLNDLSGSIKADIDSTTSQFQAQAVGIQKSKELRGGGNDADRTKIDNLIIKINDTDIKAIQDLIANFLKYIKRSSNPAIAVTLGNNDSLFNILFKKYQESKQDSDKGEYIAAMELAEGLKNNNLLPREVLQVNNLDKSIFIFATLLIRLISLSIIEYLIENNKLKNLGTSLYSYAAIYLVIFYIILLLVNIDSYRLKILLNYMNMHANSSVAYIHPLLLLVFISIIYYIATNINEGKGYDVHTDEDRVRLIYKIQVITMIVWLFLSIIVFIL